MNLGLEGRRAIVTGGTKGLGFAISKELATEGCSVAICSRHDVEVKEAVSLLQSTGATVFGEVCDVTKPLQIKEFISHAVEWLGGLDILVNNAGGATPGRFENLEDEAWEYDFSVKVMSQIRCIRASLPYLHRSSQPRVININAVYARYPDPVFLSSSVNRASCLSLSKALSIELAPTNILMNSVNIGCVETPQWDTIRQRRDPSSTLAEFTERFGRQSVPMGRFGQPDEVSGVVAFLASARASYITGASIDVAGGMGQFL